MMRFLALFLTACSGGGAVTPPGDETTPAPVPQPAPTTEPAPSTPVPDGPLPVCINELTPDNEHGWQDATGADPDWIELHNPGDTDVLLDGWTIGQDAGERDGAPLDGLTVPAGGFLLLSADGDPTLGPSHLDFQLSGAGQVLALWAPDGRGSVVAFGPTSSDRALARETDCCDTASGCWIPTMRPTPGASNAASLLPTTLLDRAASWRYLEAGSPPAAWFEVGFDDASWDSGPAPLGYGEVVGTTLAGGTPGAYFRGHFSVPSPAALTALRMRLRYDDSAVVYLNGTRIFAHDPPEVPGGYAIGEREPPVESRWHEAEVWRQLLVPGDNLLAASVAQASADSDDLRFELELRAAP
jgi:hypothetical protein